MAGEHDVDEEPEECKAKNKEKKHNSGAADLEKVTDYVEEAEISAQDIQRAMKMVNDKKADEMAKKVAREKELAKVKVNKEDVDLIVTELEIPRTIAERKLKEHGGSLVDTLVELTN